MPFPDEYKLLNKRSEFIPKYKYENKFLLWNLKKSKAEIIISCKISETCKYIYYIKCG